MFGERFRGDTDDLDFTYELTRGAVHALSIAEGSLVDGSFTRAEILETASAGHNRLVGPWIDGVLHQMQINGELRVVGGNKGQIFYERVIVE